MRNSETFAFGLALGAGLMYLLDPDRGGRRRALLRDQIASAGHDLEDASRATARHTRNRTVGLAHELKASVLERTPEDEVLEERVRSELGRAAPHARLQVSAWQGHVTLRGDVPSDEVQDLVRAARAVRGVTHVENELEMRSPATDASS